MDDEEPRPEEAVGGTTEDAKDRRRPDETDNNTPPSYSHTHTHILLRPYPHLLLSLRHALPLYLILHHHHVRRLPHHPIFLLKVFPPFYPLLPVLISFFKHVLCAAQTIERNRSCPCIAIGSAYPTPFSFTTEVFYPVNEDGHHSVFVLLPFRHLQSTVWSLTVRQFFSKKKLAQVSPLAAC